MSDAVLELRDVRKSFGRTDIIRGASLIVQRGEIHALIGPNGAGKSTLFHLVSGRLPVSSGSIRLGGVEISGKRPAAIAKAGLARSFQQTSAFREMTVAENIAVAAMRARGESGSVLKPIRAMHSVWARVEEVLTLLNLSRFRDRPAGALAYSDQRSLEIALAVAPDPAIVLLDEPTAGMTHEDVDRIIALVKRVAQGRTVLLVEHNLKVVAGLCDRITVLTRGRVLAEGDYAEVSANPEVQAAYLGTDPGFEGAH